MRRRWIALACLLPSAVGLVVATPASADDGPHIEVSYRDGHACLPGERSHAVNGGSGLALTGFGVDASAPARSDTTYEVAFWRDGHPSNPTVLTASSELGLAGGVRVPATSVTNGSAYAWHIRITTTSGTSPWSPTCRFLVDNTPPSAPNVWSTNYPVDAWGPAGERVDFVFTAGGSHRDVVAYAYTWYTLSVPVCEADGPHGESICPEPWQGPGRVRSEWIGGPAHVSIAPPGAGTWHLTVEAVDAAGNSSDEVGYFASVLPTPPTVERVGRTTCSGSATFLLTPDSRVHRVVSWEYQLGDFGSVQQVAADADGSAQLTVAVEPNVQLHVTSVSTNRFRSSSPTIDADPRPFLYSPTYPSNETSGGVGTPGQFTFSGDIFTHYTAFRYRFGSEPVQDVASEDGQNSASVTWTPTTAGPIRLSVRGRTDAGRWTCAAPYDFTVAG